VSAVAAWLAERTPRERRVLAVAAGLVVLLVAWAGVGALVDDLATLQARVDARADELAAVQRLAARLTDAPPPSADAPPLVPRLEHALLPLVGRERLARLAPLDADGRRATLRLTDVTLAEVVQVLHALEQDAAGVAVLRLDLAKHADDPQRFELTADVGGSGSAG